MLDGNLCLWIAEGAGVVVQFGLRVRPVEREILRYA
jgi:hypothetical protein